MFKTDILFAGFYGQQNTGDDAFVEVAAWGAKNIWKKINNRFLAVDDQLPQTIIPSRGYPFSIPRTYGLQYRLLLNCTDTLISAGGSTIHREVPATNAKMIALNRKRNNGNIKIGGVGVSVGPFKTINDEKAVANYLKSIDFLAVRDTASFDYVSSLDLPYNPVNSFDLAALLPEIYNFKNGQKPLNSKKIVGVSVCPYESIQRTMNVINEEKRNNYTIQLLKKIDSKEEVHFKFFVINGNVKIGDLSLTLETISKVSPKSFELVEYSKDTQAIWREIAHCDFVISTRLHAAIFACFSNTPFMLNEYHRKCGDFLNNVGYYDDYRLFDADYDLEKKSDQIAAVLANSDGYRKPKYISEMKSLAMLNFTAVVL